MDNNQDRGEPYEVQEDPSLSVTVSQAIGEAIQQMEKQLAHLGNILKTANPAHLSMTRKEARAIGLNF